MRALLLALASAACLLWASCGSNDQRYPGARESLLTDLADIVILPTYREFVAKAGDLSIAAGALRDQPGAATLAAAQQAWREARRPWKQSEAFRLGPSEDLRLRSRTKIDWTPTNPSLIEQEIAGTQELTPEYVDALGTSRRGLQALEYLLFDPDGGDEAILALLTGPDSDRRLAFIAALADDIVLQGTRLVQAWAPEGGDFRGDFIATGGGSEAFESVDKAVDAVVGAVVQLATDIEDKKIGKPAGVPQGTPDPEDLEAWRSDNTLADLEDNLESIAHVYRGEFQGHAGTGLSRLVIIGAPEIDVHIEKAIAAAQKAVREIPAPLRSSIVQDRAALLRAYEKTRELRLTLAVDLVAALGATPRFTTDGD